MKKTQKQHHQASDEGVCPICATRTASVLSYCSSIVWRCLSSCYSVVISLCLVLLSPEKTECFIPIACTTEPLMPLLQHHGQSLGLLLLHNNRQVHGKVISRERVLQSSHTRTPTYLTLPPSNFFSIFFLCSSCHDLILWKCGMNVSVLFHHICLSA